MASKISSSFKMTKALLPVLLLTLAMVFAVGINDVSAAGDAIYVNDTGGNDDNDGATWETAKKTIKNATNNVDPNGIVNIANGQYKGTNNTQITIDKNMTINGESQTGTIINGTGVNWIFHVNPGINLTLNNLTITNANRDHGGAIYNGGNLSAADVSFTGNTAFFTGGAIYNYYGGNVSVTGCSFSGNTARYGGAIHNYGSVSVSDCSFSGNTAQYYGGAISNIVSSGSVSVTNCSFTGNIAHTGGGAIHNNYGSVSVSDCSFSGNTASYYGGAIYNYYGSLSMIDCSFSGNTARYGGAIYNNGGSLSATGCSFTDNTARYGGAIHNYYYGSSVSLKGCSFIGNTAQYGGGAIHNDGGSVAVNFNRIVNNSPTAIHNGSGSVNAEYNWWGSNFEGTNPLTAGRVTNTVVNKWLVLTITANPTTIKNGETSTITADLLHDQNGVYQNPDNDHVPDGIPVTFTTTWGNLTPLTIITLNGRVSTTYTANGPSPIPLTPVQIFANADSTSVNTTVNIIKTPTSISTYDPTINDNTPSLTVNAAATPNNNSNNTNNNNTVNAATNTVTMQETGMPLIVLIMALFMVICGLVSSKK